MARSRVGGREGKQPRMRVRESMESHPLSEYTLLWFCCHFAVGTVAPRDACCMSMSRAAPALSRTCVRTAPLLYVWCRYGVTWALLTRVEPSLAVELWRAVMGIMLLEVLRMLTSAALDGVNWYLPPYTESDAAHERAYLASFIICLP